MGIDVYLGVRYTNKGIRYFTMHYFFSDDTMSDENIIDTILNKTSFSYVAGKKVFETNHRAQKYIEKNDIVIERHK